MEKKQTDTKVKPEAIVATIDSHNVLLDRLIKISILIAVLGGLCAVSPFTSLQTEFVKTGLILLGSVSAFVFFVVRTIKQNQITLPNNLFSYVLPILPIAYLIAAVFGEAPFVSLIGSGFEIGTVSFILAICLVAVLVSIEYRSKKALAWMQVGLFGFSGLVLLSLLVSFFFPQLFVLEGNRFFISEMMSGGRNIALFFGAMLLLSLSAFEFAPSRKTGRIIAGVMVLLSVLILAIFASSALWTVIGVFALFFFVSLYSFSGKFFSDATSGKLSFMSLGVVVVSAVFLLFGPTIQNVILDIPAFAVVRNIEASSANPPTFTETKQIITKTFKDNMFLGVGPNRFVTQWVQYRPTESLYKASWNVDFNYGNSILATSLVTTGLVGVLSWLILFGILLYTGIKYVVFGAMDMSSRYLSFSTFLLSVYLWIILAIGVPSAGLLTLSLFSTGLFIASLYSAKIFQARVYSFKNKPTMSFVLVLMMVVLLIGGVAFDYVVIAKTYAAHLYSNAFSLSANGRYTEAENIMRKAALFGGSDVYYRGVSDIKIAHLRALSQSIGGTPTKSEEQQITELTKGAQDASLGAYQIDDTNYLNYVASGSLLSLFVAGNDNAYSQAVSFYKEAIKRAPQKPELYLALANIENNRGNDLEAETYIKKALAIKTNYTQARFLWAQIQLAGGKTDAAIKTLQDAVVQSPFDIGAPFQLGILYFGEEYYSKAIESFELVVRLVPDHANARYYMGLAYEKIGKKAEALAQFKKIQETNPDNTELQSIIDRLSKGKSSNADTSALDTLPLDESTE